MAFLARRWAGCSDTACEDGYVYLWDSSKRQVLRPPVPIVRKESELRGH
eukprot:COSAG02_NODE_52979_length_304_cov_1.268293_1_plen_48_part_10